MAQSGMIFSKRRKSCSSSQESASPNEMVDEYTMIRTKLIDYLERPAIAIYLENTTKHVNHLRLESQMLEQKNINESMQSYTSTISHEFRTPLGTVLMFLESLL